MTEDEAKTKWCPQTKRIAADSEQMVCSCIGSDCAVWYWTEGPLEYRSTVGYTHKKGDGWELHPRYPGTLRRPHPRPEGRCGLINPDPVEA